MVYHDIIALPDHSAIILWYTTMLVYDVSYHIVI